MEFVNKKSYLGHPPKSVSLGVFWGSHPPTKKEAGSEVCVEGGGGLIDGSQPKQKHQEEKEKCVRSLEYSSLLRPT